MSTIWDAFESCSAAFLRMSQMLLSFMQRFSIRLAIG